MRAYAEVRAEADGRGGTRLAVLRSQAPLVLRDTLGGVMLVAGAGGPLGGDDLSLDVSVAPGACLRLGSAAATLVQPGPDAGLDARVTLTAAVGAGAALTWRPEPTVVAAGARLRSTARLSVQAGASLSWREVLVLGRLAEPTGSVVSRLALEIGGRPVLRQATSLGPAAPEGWDGPAVTAGHRVLGLLLLAGRPGQRLEPSGGRHGGAAYAVMPLRAGAVLVQALGATTVAVAGALDAAASAARPAA